ncbi:vWA domain-containing protein [Aidingimonas lacisalsi]|uniref:vWA domain-containing protein n=1 Tax=Aidingimonas lacisalsi TaxID=2604086 RepID=UPI0011D28256|nr:vWA domain-containing protein [Aidingimonas lacisalsi]
MRVLLVAIVWCLAWMSIPLMAQSESGSAASILTRDAGSLTVDDDRPVPDVRVIFDVSGSMRDNDPEQLSVSALELLVALLPSGIHGGIWRFGERVDKAQAVAPIDRDWRAQAQALAPSLVDYQQFTDIEAAVRAAAEEDGGQGQRHLILLTDGMIDLPADDQRSDDASRRVLLDELAPRLAEQGTVIHAIAFSPEADLAMVQRLAQSSDGLATLAETPDVLLSSFLNILERIFPSDQVPLEDDRFVIDSDVESFSALLFHEPDESSPTLVGPDGQRYRRGDDLPDDIRWQSESRFDLITIPSPEEGEWHVEGDVGSDSRISVASSLVLRTSPLPPTLYLGFDLPVSAWLEEDGERASDLPEGLEIKAELFDMEDEIQSVSRLEHDEDGRRFVGMLPAPERTGNARLVITADAEGFQRQRVQAVNVLPPISARIDEQGKRVELIAEHPGIARDNTELRAQLQGESLDIEAVDERRWVMELPELDADVSVPLLFNGTVQLEGESRELTLPDLVLNPDGRIGLGGARIGNDIIEGQALAGEESGESTATTSNDDTARHWLDELTTDLNDGVESMWLSTVPRIERLGRQIGLEPRLARWWPWLLLGVLALLVMGGLAWRRVSVRRRAATREEPHV